MIIKISRIRDFSYNYWAEVRRITFSWIRHLLRCRCHYRYRYHYLLLTLLNFNFINRHLCRPLLIPTILTIRCYYSIGSLHFKYRFSSTRYSSSSSLIIHPFLSSRLSYHSANSNFNSSCYPVFITQNLAFTTKLKFTYRSHSHSHLHFYLNLIPLRFSLP